jgi:ABC-2 type transport system ATP-binding protein
MQHVIRLDKVSKSYGKARGVTAISLTVDAGTVLGFLGPNGAGKTTTISMLLGLTRPTGGVMQLFGKDLEREGSAIRRRIGFLADDIALNKGLTGTQQLDYFAALRGGIDHTFVASLAARLHCDLTRKIKHLSRGSRQKIGLIAALMHRPDLLILDEPTSGLDPLMQAEFNKIIAEHTADGKTTFISSHVLSEVQEVCDRIVIIREGRLIADTSLAELRSTQFKQIRLTTNGKPIPFITGLHGMEHLRVQGNNATFTYKGDIHDLLETLAKAPVTDVSIKEADLESIFMQYYAGEAHV